MQVDGGRDAARRSVISVAIEHRARRIGSRVGVTRTPLHSIRGRQQHLRLQSACGNPGDGQHHQVYHHRAQTPSEPTEECGGAALGAEVSRIQCYLASETATAHCAQSDSAIQGPDPGANATDAWGQRREDGGKPKPLSPRLAGLLWILPNPLCAARP
jgi:hypothetical protein